MPKKRRLGPQNGSGSSGPEKLPKIVNYQNCQKIVLSELEKVGGHRYPPGNVIVQFLLSQNPKASEKKIGVTRGCPIIVT
jgi:hypothetical protein